MSVARVNFDTPLTAHSSATLPHRTSRMLSDDRQFHLKDEEDLPPALPTTPAPTELPTSRLSTDIDEVEVFYILLYVFIVLVYTIRCLWLILTCLCFWNLCRDVKAKFFETENESVTNSVT